MKKTLIVNYTPRVDSNTKKMLDHFIATNKDKTAFTIVDLAEDPPDLLLKENLNLYVMRNFGGVEVSPEQQKILAKNDKLASQLLEADYIVLACPMYNFTVPATVKAWFDGVIQNGKTFAYGANGPEGLCVGKQALILMTSGSDFDTEQMRPMNFATPLLKTTFGFLGVESEAINLFGTQQYADKLDTLLAEAKGKIDTVGAKWY